MIIIKELTENKVVKTYLVKTTTKYGGGYGAYLTSFDNEEIKSYLLSSGDTINKLELANEGTDRGHWFIYKNKRYDIFKEENRLKEHLDYLSVNYKTFACRAVLINENNENIEFHTIIKEK